MPIIFSTVGGAQQWILTDDQMASWAEAYPTLDVPLTCKQARVWVEANPTKRKTARGMLRFLNGWLAKSARDVRPSTAPRHAAPVYTAWVCNHIERCPDRGRCAVAKMLDRAERQAL